MPRLPEELAYLNRELRRVLRRKDVLGIVLDANGGGFLDGNCGTLAMALQRTLFPDATWAGTFYRGRLDHMVLRIGPDWYVDADGVQSGKQLLRKMVEIEKRPGSTLRDITREDLGRAITEPIGFDQCRPYLVRQLANKLSGYFRGQYRTANPAPALPGTAGWDPSWVIGVDDSSPNTRTIHILEGDREIGELTLTPSVHVPGAWRIAHALVRRGAERRGLGQAMYLVALRLLGRVHPDWEHSVSPSALRVWQALIRRDLVTGTRPKVFRPLRVVRNAESRGHWDLVFPGDWLGYSQGGATVILFPDGWRGVLDQVYTLRDPSSVPLVKAR